MIELLKKLEEEFEDHMIRYSKIAEDNIDTPIEVRVRDGAYWSMTYVEEDQSDNIDVADALIKMLKDQIKEEKNKKSDQ